MAVLETWWMHRATATSTLGRESSPVRTLFWEDMAVDMLLASSVGSLVMVLFQGLCTAPSWQRFARLACGWALARRQHTLTTSRWLTGAATGQHFSRGSVFLGCPFSQARWRVWACSIRHAAPLLPAEAPLVIECDDPTQKKAGRHIEGVTGSRHGAGSARQESRTLRGLNGVLGVRRVPLRRWPGPAVTVPIGLERSRKAAHARQPHRPYRSRSARARTLVDVVASQLPGRQMRVLGDGGDATQAGVRDLPPSVHGVSRCLLSGTLYARPEPPGGTRRGRRPRTGERLGSPKPLARRRRGWPPHPTAAKAEVHAGVGRWHTVLPGRRVRVVVVRRPPAPRATQPGPRTPRPRVAAFFTTALSRSVEDIRQPYRDRWAVASMLRDRHTFDGLGQDQCRKLPRLVGATTLRLVMAAARTRWFLDHAHHTPAMALRRHRPWSRQTCAPRPLDIVWACREAVHAAGVFPLPRFVTDLPEKHGNPDHALPSAA